MGLYRSDHPDVPAMKGLHLFHFAFSNCSQRVRIGLEEKGLPWTSHHLDLRANEHVTSDYSRIHPKALVPSLVHDGQVVIESNDILAYLDERFPEPPLQPADPAVRAEMQRSVDAAADFQSAVKVLSHELLFRAFRRVGDEEIALYERNEADPELVAFLRDYADNGPAWRDRVEAARRTLDKTLARLEAKLAESEWLSGEVYGLADISWVVNYNRLVQAGVDLSSWPHLRAWGARAMARPAFDRAVTSYRP